MTHQIFWSAEAVENLTQILDYLSTQWTEREVKNFKLKLSAQLEVIANFPEAFPASMAAPRLRRAVVTRQTTLFYEVKDDAIYIIYLFDNRSNPAEIR